MTETLIEQMRFARFTGRDRQSVRDMIRLRNIIQIAIRNQWPRRLTDRIFKSNSVFA